MLINALLPRARIAIIDLKRLEYDYLGEHCIITEYEEDSAKLLQWLCKEMDRRIDILKAAKVNKIQKYKGEMPYIVTVIDELSEIKDEKTWSYFDRLIRLARATGIHIVAASQRTSVQVISGDTRSNFIARLCFQVPSESDSRVVLGESCGLAAHLPAIKGRAIYKFGIHEKEVQAMYMDVDNAHKFLPSPERWWEPEKPKQQKKVLLPR